MPVRRHIGFTLLLVGLSGEAGAGKRGETSDGLDLSRAQRAIAEREYRASEADGRLQAPNRAHNLRTWFTASGIRVHDRTAAGSPALLELSLARVGRGSALTAVAPGEVASEGARVEIRRAGLVEWYENSAAGLEQGFTLAERTAGEGALVVELAAKGATAALGGERIVFATATGRRLAYGELVVRDAQGVELGARFEVAAPDRVRIAVEDADATYPIVIDPLLTETADAQLEGNQGGAALGGAVAAAGDVNGDGYGDVIVGASGYDAGSSNEGAAFVFLGGPGGIASGGPSMAHAQLESNQANSSFGWDVAGAGDVNGDGYADVIVGAYQYNAGLAGEGAAFVFLGSATGVANGDPTTAHAQLESNQGSALFGYSVAGAGDVNRDGYADVIASAVDYDSGQTDEGAAFVFLGSASGIASGNPATAHARLESNLGTSQILDVAGAGDVNGDGYSDVIVSSNFYDSGQTDEGAAFVFLGSASGIANGSPATAHARLESNLANAWLSSVASAGDVNGDGYSDVIVSASQYNAGQSEEGAAWIFLGSGSGIANGNPTTASAQLETNQATARLVAATGAGDVNGDGYADVIVSAAQYDAPDANEGAAWVFLGSSTGIASGNPTTAYAQLEADLGGAFFGSDVAGAGDVNGDGYADVIAGSSQYEEGESNEGAAFIYLGGSLGIADGNPLTADTQIQSDEGSALLGYSVASAGDVNGDGYTDVIVGVPNYNLGQSDEGAAFVFLGSASGIASGTPIAAATTLQSNQTFARFGEDVASAGDVNGDGYADVVVAAPDYDAGQSNEGAAFLFLGSATGVAHGNPTTAAAQLETNQADVGVSDVASAGDVNGDGFADVFVGSSGYVAGEDDEGAAFLFLGSPSGIASGSPATASAQLESNDADAFFGRSVASAGDVNGDGYSDVIVGATIYNVGQSGSGAAFVFHGSVSGIASGDATTAAAHLASDQTIAEFGTSVASAGDVNGDGYSDVIVGASQYDAGQSNEGASFVYLGSASGIASGDPSIADTQLESNQAPSRFGWSVAGAGDVNGDGYSDVIVGDFSYDGGEPDEGTAFVFLGTASGVASGNPATAATQIQSNQTSAQMGRDVASAGDVNGDGYADVIVGATFLDLGQTDEGAAFVFLGGGDGDGRPVLAGQIAAGGPTPHPQPWGASITQGGDEFDVRLTATHPAGRGRVKLEYEACAPGDAFGDPSCATGTGASWTDVTATSGGVTLTESVQGLAPNTLYRWRARVLHAPFSVTQPGVTAPPNPAHGPWRRLQGQAVEGDIRVLTDFEGDGLADVADPDDDDDGLSDAGEALAGTNPFDPDHDDDGDLDGADNCPAVANASQTNSDPLGAGDACQCGDVSGDGIVNATDVLRARERIAGRTLTGPFDLARCDVAPGDVCDLADIAALRRYLSAAPVSLANSCDAYVGP